MPFILTFAQLFGAGEKPQVSDHRIMCVLSNPETPYHLPIKWLILHLIPSPPPPFSWIHPAIQFFKVCDYTLPCC